MMEEKEHEFFYRVQNRYWNPGNTDHSTIFTLLKTAWDCHAVNSLDLDDAQRQCEEILRFMKLQKRFLKLCEIIKFDIGAYPDGFQLSGVKFETMDELEKAVKNKAFL